MKRTTNTLAIVSMPALAVGLLVGLLMLVDPFPTRYLHAQAETVGIGQLRLVDSETSRMSDFILELEQVTPPPVGQHYELWMQSDIGELLRLGEFMVDEGNATFAGSTEENLLREYSSVLISLEPDDDLDEVALTQVVLSSTLPSTFLTPARQLLVGSDAGVPSLFDSLEAQVATVSEQNNLLAAALVVDDFTEVRRRAEQIVNILDGETGIFFGDLDRDGQVQNAGDGVGVRGYLEQADTIMLDILSVVSTTEELSTQAQEITVMIEESQLLVEQLRDQARKVFAADTKAESEAITENIDLLLADITDALANIYSANLDLVAYRFNPPSATLAAGLQASQGEVARLGQLRLVDNEISRTGDFVLELEQMAPSPPNEHYELWMQADTGELTRLGELAVVEGSVIYTGSTGENLLREYSSALISLEPDDDPDEAALTRVVLSSTLPSQFLTLTRQMLAGNKEGDLALFDNLEEQIAIAAEHSGLLVDSLILDDMLEVRRHAEHIVNILDGKTGDFFGDLDRDGQAQNPGDGIGVAVYLEQTREPLDTLAAMTTADFATQAQEVIAMIEESQLLVEQSRARALDVFGITSQLDLLEAARDLVQTAALLTETAQRARATTLSLVVYEFFTPSISTIRDTASTTTSISAITVTPPFATTAGETWTHPVEGALYVFVPGGEVTLGADTADLMRATENPQHTIEVDAVWMRQTEVTNGLYKQCVAQDACTPPNNSLWQEANLADHPVTHVSWEQANAYAQWVGGRLPTEAEWESACQGPSEQEYPWGDEEPAEELSNYFTDIGSTATVGSYPEGASPYGLLDMSGNVWEWTSSQDQLYPYEAEDGREDPAPTSIHIGRGGSFGYNDQYLRCSARLGFHPTWQIPHLGFRIVLETAEPD